MTSSDNWPQPRYDIGQPKHIHALGVVAAMYNHLEFALFCLLLDYTGLGSQRTQWLFANTSNNLRLDLLKRSVSEGEGSPEVRDRMHHFADCYDLCAQNRNILMHSKIAKVDDAAVLKFSKASRNDPNKLNTLNLRLEDIRRTADDIATIYSYGINLHTNYIICNSTLTPDFFALPAETQARLRALPDKPRKPENLSRPNP